MVQGLNLQVAGSDGGLATEKGGGLLYTDGREQGKNDGKFYWILHSFGYVAQVNLANKVCTSPRHTFPTVWVPGPTIYVCASPAPSS